MFLLSKKKKTSCEIVLIISFMSKFEDIDDVQESTCIFFQLISAAETLITFQAFSH
jgi:hypothetical protein